MEGWVINNEDKLWNNKWFCLLLCIFPKVLVIRGHVNFVCVNFSDPLRCRKKGLPLLETV